MAIYAPSHKTNGLSLPHFGAYANAASAQNAIVVPECISYIVYSAANRDILYCTGIGSLGNQQFGNIATQFTYLIRVGQNNHAFLYVECAGSGYLWPAIFDMLNDAKPARSNVRKARHMTQMRYTDTIFNSYLKYA
jgi:hypothetical protein